MLVVIATLVMQAGSGPLLVAARQGEPPGTPTARTQEARHPYCDARPASASGLVAVLSRPAPPALEIDQARGEPLPPAEWAPVGNLIARWNACLASGNLRGLLGLFTADGVRRLLADREPYAGGPAGLRVSILAVSDVTRLSDGRISARVAIDPSGSGTAAPESLLMVITQGEDGAWRIDHLRSPEGPVGAAGPIPADEGSARPLLRHPIIPGLEVPIPAPGPIVPMRGGDAARTGNQPGPVPEEAPIEQWRTPVGWHSDDQPVVARGLVYFGGYSLGERTALLEAVDVASGGIRWQTTAPVAWAEFSGTPALAGDLLFAPVEAPVSGILAVVAATGQAVWFAPFGFTSVTAPAATADSVFVAGWGVRNARDRARNDTSGAVFALDQRTGRERWRYLAPVRFGPVAVNRTTVYVPSDHGLFALDRATGRKHWQARFSPGPQETPTVAGEIVAFTGTEITTGKTGIFALDAASGALRWRVDLSASPGARAGTAATAETLFVTWWDAPEGTSGTGVPTLRAYDLARGEERWIYRADETALPGGVSRAEGFGVGAVTEPVIAGEEVLFGVAIRVPAPGMEATLDGLYAIDATTGEERWHASQRMPIGSAPAVLDGQIYAMGGPRPRGDAAAGHLLAFGTDQGVHSE